MPELPVKWFRNVKTIGRLLRLPLGRAAESASTLVSLLGQEAAAQLVGELELLEAEPAALRAAHAYL